MENDEVLNEGTDLVMEPQRARVSKPVQRVECDLPEAELSLAASVGWLDGQVHNQPCPSSCHLEAILSNTLMLVESLF